MALKASVQRDVETNTDMVPVIVQAQNCLVITALPLIL